jgi:hypothetical protein
MIPGQTVSDGEVDPRGPAAEDVCFSAKLYSYFRKLSLFFFFFSFCVFFFCGLKSRRSTPPPDKNNN